MSLCRSPSLQNPAKQCWQKSSLARATSSTFSEPRSAAGMSCGPACWTGWKCRARPLSRRARAGLTARVANSAEKKSIFIAEASGKASFDTTGTKSSSTSKTNTNNGLSRVIREIAKSDFVVFLDDFHYIPVEAQTDVARQLKAAGEQGVRICTATVPHRADNVVRNNPELRGRLAQVDTTFWTAPELQ